MRESPLPRAGPVHLDRDPVEEVFYGVVEVVRDIARGAKLEIARFAGGEVTQATSPFVQEPTDALQHAARLHRTLIAESE